MKILVDADACPVKEIIVEEAKNYGISVIMISDTCHIINDGYSACITVDKGRDSVDLALANKISAGDIAVTGDYALAALILAKNAYALSPNGLIYTNDNIDRLLFVRHVSREVRQKKKGRTKGPAARTNADNENFRSSLKALIEKALKG